MFWLGLIVSLCYVPGVTGAYIATQWPVLSILLPFVLWRRGPFTWLHGLGLVFIAYAAVHLTFVPILYDGVWGVWLLCIMGLSFWLGSTSGDLRGLYRGLAIGGAVSSVIAVLQYFGVPTVLRISEHPAGLYVNSVVQGMVLALIVVALVSERMWLWVPLLLPGLLLSNSRGAWLALAVGLLSVYVRRAWVFALLGVAGLVLAVRVQPMSSDETRLLIWNGALGFLTPWGWGPGSFFSWLVPYRDTLMTPEYAHNDAIQLIFEYGFAAVVPLGIFAFALTRTRSREWPVFVTFATLGCYSMPLWVPVASFVGCVVAGRIVSGWAMDGLERDQSRFAGVPWWYGGAGAGHEPVPVVAGNQTGS
jgi:hypothetical protein